MKKFLLRLSLLCAGLIFILLASEIILRIYWLDYPEKYLSILKVPVRKTADKKIYFEHIPGFNGFAAGVNVRINRRGFRGQNIPAGKKKIFLAGDSMIFGFGLREKFTISRQLQDWLPEDFYVINAGVCGYNFSQYLEILKRNRDINSFYTFISFIHNDIENLNIENSDKYPEVKSSYFKEPDPQNLLVKLYRFMVPFEISKKRFKKSLRVFLINNSRLYLFTAVKLKSVSYNFAVSEKPVNYLNRDSMISDELIWKPFEKKVEEFSEFTRQNKMRYSIIIMMDKIIKGEPILKIIKIFDKYNVNYYNLQPYLPSDIFKGSKYILGWDPHPNRRGAGLYAGLIADILRIETGINPRNIIKTIKNKQQYIEDEKKYINSINPGKSSLNIQNYSDIIDLGSGKGVSQIVWGTWNRKGSAGWITDRCAFVMPVKSSENQMLTISFSTLSTFEDTVTSMTLKTENREYTKKIKIKNGLNLISFNLTGLSKYAKEKITEFILYPGINFIKNDGKIYSIKINQIKLR